MESIKQTDIITGDEVRTVNWSDYKGYILHMICEEGHAEFNVGEQVLRLQEGSLLALPDAGTIISTVVSPSFRCTYILAVDKVLYSLLPARNYSINAHMTIYTSPVVMTSHDRVEIFRNDILAVKARVADIHHKFYDEMIGGLLRTLIYDFFDIHSEFSSAIPEMNRATEISQQFFLLIESGRVKYEREPAHYASALHVSRKYLNTVIKRLTGGSVSYHLNRTAKAMIIDYLNDNKLSISQIADEMNFSSLEYFSRFCKKHLGMSPTKFRQSRK